MAKKRIGLPSISRVAAGSVAVLELPIGPTYKNITFTAAGAGLLVSHFGKITVNVNGNERQTFKNLQRLMHLNGYYNRGVDTVNQFKIHFDRAEFATLADKRATGLGTLDVETLTIEIEILAGSPITALTATAFVETVGQPLGVFTQIKEQPLDTGGATEIEFDKLQRASNQVYQAIHFFKPDVNEVGLKVDNVDIVNKQTKALLERDQREVRPVARVPQTAVATHLDFNLEGDVGDCISMKGVQDARLIIKLGAAGLIELVTEELVVFNAKA